MEPTAESRYQMGLFRHRFHEYLRYFSAKKQVNINVLCPYLELCSSSDAANRCLKAAAQGHLGPERNYLPSNLGCFSSILCEKAGRYQFSMSLSEIVLETDF